MRWERWTKRCGGSSNSSETRSTSTIRLIKGAIMNDHGIADKACQAMQAIFRPKAGQSVESYFSENVIQHDPHMRDGLAGLKELVDEVAQSGHGDVTIYRKLVDGDLVAIHSKCAGFKDFSGPMIAVDI